MAQIVAQTTKNKSLLIFAAASLSDVMMEASTQFEKTHPQVEIHLQLASTSTLKLQIQAKIKADIFLSASSLLMRELETNKLILPHSTQIFAHNRMLLIGSLKTPNINSIQDLLSAKIPSIALCHEAVPIGYYAKKYLEKHGLYERIQSKSIYVDHVRSGLAMIEKSVVSAAFVYQSDVRSREAQSRILLRIPPEDMPEIQYVGAVLKQSQSPILAKEFLSFITGTLGQNLLKKYGFL